MDTPTVADPLDAALPQTAPQPPATAQQPNAIGQSFRDLPQYETVEIGDEAAAARTQVDFYKGRKNITDRLAVLDLKRIQAARRHFHDATKGPVICRSSFRRTTTQGPDGKTLYNEVMTKKEGCCEMLGESSKKFASPVVVYATDPKGAFRKPFSFELKIWVFGAKIFQTLQEVHKEHDLATHDVKVTCTEEQYQNMTIVPCAEAMVAHAKFQAEYGVALKNWLDAVHSELRRAIGRDVPDDEIRKLIGEAPTGAAVAASGPLPGASLDDLLG